MANFPTSLDSLANPTGANTLDSPPHATQHTDANDILEALEAKVGIGASTPTTVGHVLTVTGAGATAYQAGGGGGGVEVLGPFSVAWNTPNINTGVSLVALASGTIVLQAWARITTTFTPSKFLRIGAGGSGAISNGDYWNVTQYNAPVQSDDAGAWSDTSGTRNFVAVLDAGHLVGVIQTGTLVGAADLYALITV